MRPSSVPSVFVKHRKRDSREPKYQVHSTAIKALLSHTFKCSAEAKPTCPGMHQLCRNPLVRATQSDFAWHQLLARPSCESRHLYQQPGDVYRKPRCFAGLSTARQPKFLRSRICDIGGHRASLGEAGREGNPIKCPTRDNRAYRAWLGGLSVCWAFGVDAVRPRSSGPPASAACGPRKPPWFAGDGSVSYKHANGRVLQRSSGHH